MSVGRPRGMALGAALLVLALGLSGCRTTPRWDGKYPIYGSDPHPYAEGFSDAATTSFVQSLSGHGYVTIEPPNASAAPSAPRLCGSAELNRAWSKDFRTCQVVRIAAAKGCNDYDGCLTFDVDPSLLSTQFDRAILIYSLETPCSFLADPTTLKSAADRERRVAGLWTSPDELWKRLRCDAGGIHSTVTSAQPGVIQVRF